MFYWIYDVPSFLVVALFVTVFVGAFSNILASFIAFSLAYWR